MKDSRPGGFREQAEVGVARVHDQQGRGRI